MKAGPYLAWLQLTKQKGHFLAAVSGVAFAVALMFSQIGLRDGLLTASVALYKHLRGDIVMTSWEYRFQEGTAYFPQARIAQALAVEGVDRAMPVWISPVRLDNPVTHKQEQIVLSGSDPYDDIWDFDGTDFHPLQVPDTVIFDAASRSLYGPLETMLQQRGRVPVLVSRHLVDVVGVLRLGPDFGVDGYLFSSHVTFDHVALGGSLPVLGVIRIKPGEDPQRVLGRLRAQLPEDVKLSLMPDFLEAERQYWLVSSAVGIVFTAMLLLGIVVGAVVVYQILYSDVTNHLPEYATMKAMGYADAQLFSVVMAQAAYISVLGFFPGELISELIFLLLRRATQLPLELTVLRSFEVYGMTLLMCLGSGAVAMQALRRADPAEIF